MAWLGESGLTICMVRYLPLRGGDEQSSRWLATAWVLVVLHRLFTQILHIQWNIDTFKTLNDLICCVSFMRTLHNLPGVWRCNTPSINITNPDFDPPGVHTNEAIASPVIVQMYLYNIQWQKQKKLYPTVQGSTYPYICTALTSIDLPKSICIHP